MLNIGQRLYLIRLEKGMTQEELANRAEIPQSGISNIEKEKRDITVSTLLKLCLALEVEPSELFKRPERSVQPILFTRKEVEKIAQAVMGRGVSLSRNEKEIAGLVRQVMHQESKRYVPNRKIYRAWNKLRNVLKEDQISILTQRVMDLKARMM